jgi:hypothetical protein
MPDQPGKGLLMLATFSMNTPMTNIRQRVGYFKHAERCVLSSEWMMLSMVLRSKSIPTPGTPSDARTVNQADLERRQTEWHRAVGVLFFISKTQIFWCDFRVAGVVQFVVGLSSTVSSSSVIRSTMPTCRPLST